jgi:hypothetical protein
MLIQQVLRGNLPMIQDQDYVGDLELMVIFVSISNLKLVARTRRLRWFNGEFDNTALLASFEDQVC